MSSNVWLEVHLSLHATGNNIGQASVNMLKIDLFIENLGILAVNYWINLSILAVIILMIEWNEWKFAKWENFVPGLWQYFSGFIVE